MKTRLSTRSHSVDVLASLLLHTHFGSLLYSAGNVNRMPSAIDSEVRLGSPTGVAICDERSHTKIDRNTFLEGGEHWPPALASWLRSMNGFERWGQSLSLPVPMEYAILQGRSSVQALHEGDVSFVCDHKQLLADDLYSAWNATHSRSRTSAAWAVSGGMFWLLGKADLAHEALLGTFNMAGIDSNIQFFLDDLKLDGWRERHGLLPEQVLFHAALHRAEGPLEADGLSLTGYENAKIWYSRLDPQHVVLEHLAQFAKQHAPMVAERCVVSQHSVERRIPVRQPGLAGAAAWSGPGVMVKLAIGRWDPYAFIDLCRELRENEKNRSEEYLELYRQTVRVQQEELSKCFWQAVQIATARSA